jgi:hypothetical protein
VKEVASPEEIRAEELALKKFGLVPPEFDLAGSTVDLLTEQAAAFYDYNKKKLFITDSTPSDTQEPVLVHELAHALADQNFNLARYIKQSRESDDGASARLAVMEGQASWLMAEYLARRGGQSLKESPALVAMMSRMTESSAGQFPIFERAPLYLRRTLVFPYTHGMLFQHAAVMKTGQDSFAEVFRRPPVSTQQILHPEKYFANVTPTTPALPEPPKERGLKHLVGGTLGELEHAILLEQFGGRQLADELAPYWRGSRFELREDRRRDRLLLLYASEWGDDEAAARYFRFYREALRKKWRRMEIASETPQSVAGNGDDGGFMLRRNGAVVTSMEGLPAAVN